MKKLDLSNKAIADLFDVVCKNPPPNPNSLYPSGFTTQEILSLLPINTKRATVKADGELLLEDAEHKFMVELVGRNQWRMFNDDIANFIKMVNDAPSVDVKAV